MGNKVLNVDFVASIVPVAKAFLKRAGEINVRITLSVSGHTAWTQFSRNDKGWLLVKLNMPALDVSGSMTRAQADMMIAYVLHEISHNLYTDSAAWDAALNSVDYYDRKPLHHLINALEDVRIEGEGLRRGLAGMYRERLESLVDFLHGKALGESFNPNAPGSMLWVLCVLGRVRINGYRVPSAASLESDLEPGNRAAVDDILDKLARARSTGDVCDIALEIFEQVKADKPDPMSEPPRGDEPGDEQGEPGDEQGEPGDEPGEPGSGDEQGDESGSGSSDEQGDESDESDEQGDESGSSDEQGDESDESGSSDEQGDESGEPGAGAGSWLENINLDDLQSVEPSSSDIIDRGEINRSHEIIHKAIKGTHPLSTDLDYGDGYLARAELERARAGLAVPGALRAQVRRIVRAPARMKVERFKNAGRLDIRAVPAMRAGKLDVYSRRFDTPGEKAAVSLLVDCSGSMYADRGEIDGRTIMPISCAIGLAAHLADAMKAAGVPFEVAGYEGGNNVFMAKAYDETYGEKARTRLGRLFNIAGGTDITTALIGAAKRARELRNVDRRIVILLTDGACAHGPSAVRGAVQYAETLGIEVAGLGIDIDIEQSFPVSQKVDNMLDLGRAGLGVLVERLTR